MQKLKSIILIFILGITLFPWQSICVSHPFGHDHHNHKGPSPCELRQQYKGREPIFWPPMECKSFLSQFDVFEQPENEKTKPVIEIIAIVTVFFDLITLENIDQPFLFPPNPNCRSATLLSDSPLRAPPLV